MRMIALMLGVCLMPTFVWAAEESYNSYDSIVNELKSSASEPVSVKKERDDFDWEDVALHGGLSFATSWVSFTAPNGLSGAGLMKGVEFSFGTNLFTPALRAEGSFTNYSQNEFDSNLHADLKEFELRLVYLNEVRPNTFLRVGTGLTARYLNANAAGAEYEASTPMSILLVGFEHKLSRTWSVGPDLSYRSALIGDTFEKTAWDASFRLNATF